ncbi:integrin alpha-M-like [Hyperolius riggenbachi]|uniref:integrin alpha-M-like n=1 Tax=Hyperolius riggenbachi TaxID=752182 RepID=UPI0035A3BDF0
MNCCLPWVLLGQVLTLAGAFFVDLKQPIIFQSAERSFGYQVVQLDKGVVVGAPLQQVATNTTGQLYRCDPRNAQCTPVSIPGSADNVNATLGLTLAAQEESPSQLLVCGPTLQRTCGDNIYVNGRCYQLGQDMRVIRTLPSYLPECTVRPLDIAFLIDGSGSIRSTDFTLMIQFVSRVIEAFTGSNTQFALMQYSHRFETQFTFDVYSRARDTSQLTKNIFQQRGGTKTSTAIQMVMQDLFTSDSGARENAEKVLIVITDGESIGDETPFSVSIEEADRRGVRRFVIGVGNAFNKENAYKELVTIASPKAEDHILRVNDFSALISFQKTLQDKIFAIEGTQSAAGSSFQLEMSQEGFSAVLTPYGPILGAVGAYDWSGGISVYTDGPQNGTWINATKDSTGLKDSYMGYAVQQLQWDIVAIGAPRHQHLGSVFIYRRDPGTSQWSQAAVFTADKIGSYFGSVLSVLPVNSTQSLLAVGAPTYYSPEAPGGRVYLCTIKSETRNSRDPTRTIISITCPDTLKGDSSQSMGHFGSAISVLPDLTGDQLPDLAIGAPCEDNFHGAIYIFPGKDESFRKSYIQRIAGEQVSSGIKYFGRSLSGNQDMTQDNLPDLVVGGEGRVLVVRSRPALGVSVSMTFNPRQILLPSYECSEGRRLGTVTTLTLCFNSYPRNTRVIVADFGQLTYTLLLDAGRTNTRALFSTAGRSMSTSQRLQRGEMCSEHLIQLPECVEDSLSPLRVALNFSLAGTPVLTEDSPTTYNEEVSFEKNCGADGVCQDDLSLKINFTGLTQLVVGPTLGIDITVSVKNQGDDSYNTRVLIPFPPDLSYRTVSQIQGNKRAVVSCATLERQRVLSCGVNRPLLRPKTMVDFIVSFHVSPTATLGDTLIMTANVTSDNGGTQTALMKSSAQLRVLYGVYVTINSLEESSKYQNFSTDNTTIEHVYRVINLGTRNFPLSVILMVPVRLGETVIWERPNITSSEPELSTCAVTAESPGADNFQESLSRSPIVNCLVAQCFRVECKIPDLQTQNSLMFTISGSVTKDWTTQTGQQKISLQSSAEITYDPRTYAHILEEKDQHIKAQALTVLEIQVEYNYYPIIIGSSVGGLVLLALITAGLYKLGFFKRQYKEMLQNPAGSEADNLGTQNGGAPAE